MFRSQLKVGVKKIVRRRGEEVIKISRICGLNRRPRLRWEGCVKERRGSFKRGATNGGGWLRQQCKIIVGGDEKTEIEAECRDLPHPGHTGKYEENKTNALQQLTNQHS